MWRLVALFFCFANALGDFNKYCANMYPQTTVDIMQMMGMWYAVEKIDHLDERHHVRTPSVCPIIHISEDQPPTTVNPLYNRNGHHRTYSEGYGYGSSEQQYPKTQEQIERKRLRKQQYERERTRSDERDYATGLYQEDTGKRYLRIFSDEEGEDTEYHVWYNVSAPGFWISFGPENGGTLKSQFRYYAGNIQVLKAVGSHMLITFCHQVPESQLYSILFSRETKLDPIETDIVHRMLHRKGLRTHAVEKLCNNSGSRIMLSNSLGLLLIIFFVYSMAK